MNYLFFLCVFSLLIVIVYWLIYVGLKMTGIVGRKENITEKSVLKNYDNV